MQGKKESPRGHSLHPQAAPLLSWIVLPLLHNVCVMLFLTSLLYRLFLLNQQQSPSELNQEIIRTFRRTKLASSLNQSKLKIAEKEAFGIFVGRMNIRAVVVMVVVERKP